MNYLKNYSPLLLLLFAVTIGFSQGTVTGELRKWHKVSITFNGPETSEDAAVNPFMDYRLNVTFISPSGNEFIVPGFYAADGDAAETSAVSGNKWRVHFTPDETGEWEYEASFRTGANVAISLNPDAGSDSSFDGAEGEFNIGASNKAAPDNRAKGRLSYDGTRYLVFEETGEYFLKAGSDSPENLLAYNDFDNTANSKNWAPHRGDWQAGDPYWKNNRGRELIGAVNYLASEGMNAFSFLTMNVIGDGNDVWPWAATNTNSLNETTGSDANNRLRYDVSKLAQWEILFEHADSKGMFLHFKTQETENDQLLDQGELGNQRMLYYRELIARFGHHLALNWNLGEENDLYDEDELGDTNGTRLKAYAEYIHNLDPYDHHIVVHAYPWAQDILYPPLLGNDNYLTGPSMQLYIDQIHSSVKRWITDSGNAGKQWVVTNDEQGTAQRGVTTDEDFNGNSGNEEDNRDEVRYKVLWGTLMAGGAGVEYYFGYNTGETDLNAEDFRSRKTKWEDAKRALDFFNAYIPFWEMEANDEITSDSNDFCLARVGERYLIYLPEGGSTNLNLASMTGDFTVQWFDPRNGGNFQNGSVTSIAGGASRNIGNPPNNAELDWVVLIEAEDLTSIGITRVSVTPSEATISVAETITLDVEIIPSNATNQNVFWESSNTNVATVDQNGVVTGVNEGITVISAISEDGTKRDTAVIDVIAAEECTGNFTAVDGLVVIEAENLDLSSGWVVSTSETGYTGSGYLAWEGGDNLTTPGNGLISAEIEISDPGTYRFQWHNKVGQGSSTTDYNDSWLRFPDADDFYALDDDSIVYPNGSGNTPEAAGDGEDGWFKVYTSGTIDWTFSTNTNDNNPHQIYVTFDNPGVYTIEISGRSNHHLIDRIVLSHSDEDAEDARELSLEETPCDGDGGNISVSGVTVSPGSGNIEVGNTINLSASVLPANATNSSVIWSSSNTTVATVDQSGEVTGIAEGPASIIARTEDGDFTDSALITVTVPDDTPVVGIRVNPQFATLNVGEFTTLTYQINPANATNTNATWSSSDTTIATVDQNGVVTGVSAGRVDIIATSEDGGFVSDATVQVRDQVEPTTAVSGVSVTPETTTLIEGNTVNLIHEITPVDATNQNVVWISSNTSIATVNQTGVVTGLTAGNVVITVRTEDGDFTDTSNVEVLPLNIPVSNVFVSPPSVTLMEGETVTLSAQVSPTDATNDAITWSSTNSAIAFVDSNGFVTAIAEGNATITATTADGGFTDTSQITVTPLVENIPIVSLVVRPQTLTLTAGDVFVLQTQITPTNATNQNLVWSSNNSSIATVNQFGQITAIAAGAAIITVETEDGNLSSDSNITILDATSSPCGADYEEIDNVVIIEAENLDFPSGWSQRTAVDGYSGEGYLEWLGGDNPETPGSGLITTMIRINDPGVYRFQWRGKVGTGTNPTDHNDSWLRFRDASDFYGQKSNGDIVYPKGSGKTPEAAGEGSDGWLKVYANQTLDWTWETSTNDNDPYDVFVSFDAPGVYIMEISGRSNNHFLDKIALSKNVDATDLSLGETLCDGTEAVTGIVVSPETLSIDVNESAQLSYQVTPANATNTNVTWTSSATAIASVDESGLVRGLQEGSATITARTEDGNFTDTSVVQIVAIPATSCGTDFVEQDGLVIIEAENMDYPEGWVNRSNIEGFAGNGYLSWEGGENPTTPGNGFISTKIRINTPGTYLFEWRNKVGSGTDDSQSNDSWLRFPDADDFFGQIGDSRVYPKGSGNTPEATGSGSDGWFKVYSRGTTDWTWSTYTSDSNTYSIYVSFDEPGEYTMEISGRSNNHILDRIVLSNNIENSTDLSLGETRCSGTTPVVPVVSISVTPEEANINVADIFPLKATVSPVDASNPSFNWSSSDNTIATVNVSGEVTAIREGTVVITATTIDGNYTASSTIQVISNNKCGADYVEIDGVLVIEGENIAESQGWQTSNAIQDFSGEGYIEWTGINSPITPGNGPLSTSIRVGQAGTYLFQWRTKVGQGTAPNQYNDSWVRFPDADDFYGEREDTGSRVYPKGSGKSPEVDGPGADGWFKVYSGETLDWTWNTYTSDSAPHLVYVTFDNPGVYTMELSGRAQNHLIDRIVLSKEASNATSLNLPETTCDNVDKNSFPRMKIENASAYEGETMEFTINLNKPSTEEVVIALEFAEGTASEVDYISAVQTITFEAGVTTKVLSVPTLKDEEVEDAETFRVIVNNVLSGAIADVSGNGIGTILDQATLLDVYPNPVAPGDLIRLDGIRDGQYDMLIYSISGVLVQKEKIVVENSRHEILIKNLPVGIYLLRAVSVDRIFNSKIVVK